MRQKARRRGNNGIQRLLGRRRLGEKMHCGNCDQFDVEIAIHSLDQLVRVAEAVRAGVASGVIHYNVFQSDRELIGQRSFLELDLRASLPDVLRYHFDCPACGKCFGLFVETYHGAGGKWLCMGPLPPKLTTGSKGTE